MSFMTTFLAAIADCMVLLVGAAFWIDAPLHDVPSTGLTAATVIGTDGMAPVGHPSDQGIGTVASGGKDEGVAVGDQG